MPIRRITHKKLTWINIEKVDKEALEFLTKNYSFHHLDLEDVQGENQTPKIDVYKDYLFVVLQFPHWQAHSKRVISHEVDIFLGKDFLITVQHNKSKELKNFFYRCMRNKRTKADWMNNSSAYLFYNIVESLFRNSQPILNNIGKLVSNLEDEVFDDRLDSIIVKQLAMHRRNVLTFRRILDPQRFLVSNLTHMRNDYLDKSLHIYFDNVNDYLNKLWSITDGYRDTIEGLHTTVESLINRRTNKVIEMLTIISVALLPLTLLAGIYGMNIKLPYAGQPLFVWGLFIGLLALVILAIIFMRKKRML